MARVVCRLYLSRQQRMTWNAKLNKRRTLCVLSCVCHIHQSTINVQSGWVTAHLSFNINARGIQHHHRCRHMCPLRCSQQKDRKITAKHTRRSLFDEWMMTFTFSSDDNEENCARAQKKRKRKTNLNTRTTQHSAILNHTSQLRNSCVCRSVRLLFALLLKRPRIYVFCDTNRRMSSFDRTPLMLQGVKLFCHRCRRQNCHRTWQPSHWLMSSHRNRSFAHFARVPFAGAAANVRAQNWKSNKVGSSAPSNVRLMFVCVRAPPKRNG